MKRKFRPDVWGGISLAILAAYALFMFYPLVHLFYQAVVDPETHALTGEYFAKFFGKAYYFKTLLNSLKVTTSVTLLTIAVGVPLAYCFTMYKLRGENILRILIILSSMSAPFIGAYSWILLLGRNGMVTNVLKGLLNWKISAYTALAASFLY